MYNGNYPEGTYTYVCCISTDIRQDQTLYEIVADIFFPMLSTAINHLHSECSLINWKKSCLLLCVLIAGILSVGCLMGLNVLKVGISADFSSIFPVSFPSSSEYKVNFTCKHTGVVIPVVLP